VAQMQATGSDIVKIATTATEIVDVARMFQILVYCQVSSTYDYTEVIYMYQCKYMIFQFA
jgi:3-dehydroquinate dehydratase